MTTATDAPLLTRIQGAVIHALEWMGAAACPRPDDARNGKSSRIITNGKEAAQAMALRELLAQLKDEAINARDAEHLPLMAQAQDVLARFNPQIARIKSVDDKLRHALTAWEKRLRRVASNG